MEAFERYFAAVRFVEGLANIAQEHDYMKRHVDPGVYLKRMRYFLDLLGAPDRGMQVIHIGGTAGKGSTVGMVHEILRLHGKNVGSFTSPAVSVAIESIRVGELYIAPDDVAALIEQMKPHIDAAYRESPYGGPSAFEVLFALALLYFKQQQCEWVILEVGLGGAYDATNVIEHPKVTAITTIDIDHVDILGHTKRDIAVHKAGIIKKGSVFFTGEQSPSLAILFKKVCAQKHVPFHQTPRLADYRARNAALATMIAQSLAISPDTIQKGIARAHMPCRFEVMQKSPTVVLDGAHNPAKIQSTLSNLDRLSYKKLHVILGTTHDKQSRAMLRLLIPRADALYVTRFQSRERMCTSTSTLYTHARKYLKKGAPLALTLDPNHALDSALKEAKSDDLILVVGSFYLAGELRKRWVPEEWMLTHRRDLVFGMDIRC